MTTKKTSAASFTTKWKSRNEDKKQQPPPQQQEQQQPIQLYRPTGGKDQQESASLLEFLFRTENDITEDDVVKFLNGEHDKEKDKNETGEKDDNDNNDNDNDNDENEVNLWRERFWTRKAEIEEWRHEYFFGRRTTNEETTDNGIVNNNNDNDVDPTTTTTMTTRIDEDGRLVRGTQPPPQPPNANLPPPQPLVPGFDDLGGVGGLQEQQQQRQQQQQQWMEQERVEAAEAIARAVQRYRAQGVPEDDFEVVVLTDPPTAGAGANGANANGAAVGGFGIGVGGFGPMGFGFGPNRRPLTLRRIVLALLGVASIAMYVAFRTMHLWQTPEKLDPHFDKLLHELLDVRWLIPTHLQECHGLHRSAMSSSSSSSSSSWFKWNNPHCDEGVLHIPAKHVLAEKYQQLSSEVQAEWLRPYAEGIDFSWTMPCSSSTTAEQQEKEEEEKYPTESSSTSPLCFRGVHDNLIPETEVDRMFMLGFKLKRDGADHFDIHEDLHVALNNTLDILRELLTKRYAVDSGMLRPVAYRINIAGPMDGNGVNMNHLPAYSMNQPVRNVT